MYQNGDHDWIGSVNGRRFRVPAETMANEITRHVGMLCYWDMAPTEAEYQARQTIRQATYWQEHLIPPTMGGVDWIDPPC